MSKKDFGWKHGYEKEGEKGIFCKYCHHKSTGGITRLKDHLAQTRKGVSPCPQVPEDVKKQCVEALKTYKDVRSRQTELLREIGEGPGSGSKHSENSGGCSGTNPSGGGSINQSIHQFVNIDARQTTINSAYKKELRIEVCRKIGRWMYSAALPFNCVNDVHYKPMVDGIAEYGRGFKPPSMHELRTWILKAEVDDINFIFEEHKKSWQEYGCTIMTDGWTDGKSRALINFLVNSAGGTFFLKSVDVSDSIKNGELIFNYLDEVVREIGEENVIQVITDNASNCKNAGKRLEEKWNKLWWTPCAAHCIDLMLEDIGKLKIFADTINQAKRVVKFIYAHSIPLSLMREHTQNKELLRPAITRFATTFLTLQSLYKQKRALEVMFSSDRWVECSHAKTLEGKLVKRIVVSDPNFWPHVAFCVKAVVPLVCVLREVDSEERPSMGYIYELMDTAKETIKFNLGGVQRKYGPIWKKIDARWTPQLHRPLHAAGYYLNPQLRYEKKFSNCKEVRDGLHACMERMLSSDDCLLADIQLDSYDKMLGDFGTPLAKKSRMMRSPASWWTRFGSNTPELANFSIRVLSLTCSASGCERNWSTFESIHTKKRNRLEHRKLNALVYVKYNLKLRERSIKRRDKIDPIVVDHIESDDEWIAEKEDPALPENTSWLEDDELFSGDPIVSLPPEMMDSGLESQIPIVDVESSPVSKKRKVGESSGGCVKGKEVMVTIEEDAVGGIDPKYFDSGSFPNIDTLDQDDSDIILDESDYF